MMPHETQVNITTIIQAKQSQSIPTKTKPHYSKAKKPITQKRDQKELDEINGEEEVKQKQL